MQLRNTMACHKLLYANQFDRIWINNDDMDIVEIADVSAIVVSLEEGEVIAVAKGATANITASPVLVTSSQFPGLRDQMTHSRSHFGWGGS